MTEVVPIEGIDLENTPPCQLLFNELPCGLPSVARILSTCPVHGTARQFICKRCLEGLLSGKGWCTSCGSRRPFGGYC